MWLLRYGLFSESFTLRPGRLPVPGFDLGDCLAAGEGRDTSYLVLDALDFIADGCQVLIPVGAAILRLQLFNLAVQLGDDLVV